VKKKKRSGPSHKGWKKLTPQKKPTIENAWEETVSTTNLKRGGTKEKKWKKIKGENRTKRKVPLRIRYGGGLFYGGKPHWSERKQARDGTTSTHEKTEAIQAQTGEGLEKYTSPKRIQTEGLSKKRVKTKKLKGNLRQRTGRLKKEG